ncbi:MAG: NADH-quinone oxidoreductase subunit L [Desulfuromonas sp.]|nr:MAG: NADH-quinone oxidoreductase subunit L [Desulfuromonas sp.]
MNPLLLFLIPILPLFGGVINVCFGSRLPHRLVSGLSVAAVSGSFLLATLLWPLGSGEGTRVVLFSWLKSAGFQADVGILFDPLAAVMTLMVTGVATLIHLYAAGYMAEDESPARFFALLNLFVFAMLCIVLADNLLFLFLGWEGVGFCSYGLIGFWYRNSKNASAGRKAFIVTRIGDLFFAIALLWLFSAFGTVMIEQINARVAELDPLLLTGLTLLLLGGACGKSAQLPLMSWLPDAMAGPTPVSALIHAATMVTAGVYLLCRMFPLVSLSPTGMAAIALVGALTALYAASCALAQREIKRVLAYSTMSQIGYMFLAVGVGTVSGAMFHLLTHAFFKALLFMGAGCVIHLAGGENDIYRMGGLKEKSPQVFWLFLVGILCLAGTPLTGGFFSKDAILLTAFAAGDGFYATLWGIGVLTAGLTSFYSFRLLYLVFFGTARQAGQGHAPSPLMLWTLPPLALLGLCTGLLNLPHLFGGHEWLTLWLGQPMAEMLPVGTEIGLLFLMLIFFVGGWVIAHVRYRTFPGDEQAGWRSFLLSGWQADRVYELILLRPYRAICRFCWQGGDKALIDGVMEGLARLCLHWGDYVRRLSNGQVAFYLQGFAWGLLLIVGWFLLASVK